MAKKATPAIKLAQPDRSSPSASAPTLLDIAEQRGILKTPEDEEVLVGRFGESILWTASLSMLHFTLDVLVMHQYAVDIEWPVLISRALKAFPVIFLLFYILHPHPSPSGLLPRNPIPQRQQSLLHQLFFFLTAITAGCYLIFITNRHGYYAVMKQAPPLGSLWIWAVIELDVLWATASLVVCGAFLKGGGFAYL